MVTQYLNIALWRIDRMILALNYFEKADIDLSALLFIVLPYNSFFFMYFVDTAKEIRRSYGFKNFRNLIHVRRPDFFLPLLRVFWKPAHNKTLQAFCS